MASLGSQGFSTNITDVATTPVTGIGSILGATFIATFTPVSGGGTCVTRVQTTLDNGVTWHDIARFDFTTTAAVKYANVDATTAVTPAAISTALGSETTRNGLMGDRLRMITTTASTAYGPGSKVEIAYQTR